MSAPPRSVDAWRLGPELGRGGVGVVYEATHRSLGTRHAIKLIPCAAPRLRARIIREGRLQAQLRSPHVVRVTDMIELPAWLCLVADLVDGPDLRRWARTRSPDRHALLTVLRGVAAGLAHAHAAGVVHRDVKPANVLVEDGPDGPRAVLTDFGIARALQGRDAETLTDRDCVVGTVSYMPPELLGGRTPAAPTADVFSFGCLAWELLRGDRPFPGRPLPARLAATRLGPPDPLRGAPDLPPAVAAVIRRCLAPRPGERYPDGAALLQALDGAVATAPATSVVVEATRTLPV